MAEESKSTCTWEGKASAELTGTTADQVWPLLEDFCNIDKWIPMDTCYQVEGVANQPGLIRHCTATVTATTDDADQPERISTMWAKEKLLSIDSIQRCLTYEVADSNMGFKSYVATVKVLPITSDGKPAECCKIELSFVCDPVQGWTFEGFYSDIQSSVQSMAKKMELAFSA